MTNMLRNGHGRFLQSHELMPLLGFRRGAHLPIEGFGPREILGVFFICVPAIEEVNVNTGRVLKRSKSRIRYRCTCQKWVPFGRASQHKCKIIAPALAPKMIIEHIPR